MKKTNQGFTLAEILLAMLVFAIAITTILALLARSVETAQEILTKDEAIGLSSAVENYMTSIPFYSTVTDETNAYQTVRDQEKVLIAYRYRGNSSIEMRADGTLVPMTTPTGGEVLSGVRWYDVVSKNGDPFLNADVAALDSRLFRVILSVSPANPPWWRDPDRKPGDPKEIPSNPNSMTTTPSGDELRYNSAVLVVYADFYSVPTVGFNPVDAGVSPVFSFNFAVRR